MLPISFCESLPLGQAHSCRSAFSTSGILSSPPRKPISLRNLSLPHGAGKPSPTREYCHIQFKELTNCALQSKKQLASPSCPAAPQGILFLLQLSSRSFSFLCPKCLSCVCKPWFTEHGNSALSKHWAAAFPSPPKHAAGMVSGKISFAFKECPLNPILDASQLNKAGS